MSNYGGNVQHNSWLRFFLTKSMQILNRAEYSDRLSFPGEQLANVFFNNFFKSTNRKTKTNGLSFMSGCLLKRRGVFSSANASWKLNFQFNIRNISFNMELLGYGSRPFPFHPFPVPWGFHTFLIRFCFQNLLQPISRVTCEKNTANYFDMNWIEEYHCGSNVFYDYFTRPWQNAATLLHAARTQEMFCV